MNLVDLRVMTYELLGRRQVFGARTDSSLQYGLLILR